MQKIVTIGGGTGQFQILKGLKNYDCTITAISNMADDGGSSGKLMDEYGILPPGDIRQCMVALANGEKGKLLRDLFSYRFKKGEEHNLGNLILTALMDICGGSAEGIEEATRLLGINHSILPVTLDKSVLCAKTEEGKILKGESSIDDLLGNSKINELFYEKGAFVYRKAANAIREANKVIICSGDLYRSIIPTLIVNGVSTSLKESNAKKFYVCNLFTKAGTYGFKASDFVKEIERYSGVTLENILINNQVPSKEVREKYLSEKSVFVEDDMQDDSRVVRGNYVAEYPSERKTIFRHVPEEIAREIIGL
jgi:uncharacterized cofD-like protein